MTNATPWGMPDEGILHIRAMIRTAVILAMCACPLFSIAEGTIGQDRIYAKKWGVFNHYIADADEDAESWNRKVDSFDVEKLADRLKEVGAGFYFITVMQGSKFMIAPNTTYDTLAGTKPGEACAHRDLIADLIRALDKRDIDLYLYYTGDGPYRDPVVGGRIGFVPPREGGVTPEFVARWAAVMREYAIRYGKGVKGWWVDGCYDGRYRDRIGGINRYTRELLKPYAVAAKRGNPESIVACNNGVMAYYYKYGPLDEFTSGEFDNFVAIPPSRFIDGAQAFALIPIGVHPTRPDLGGWGCAGVSRDKEFIADYVALVNKAGGVVALDVRTLPDGSWDEDHLEVLRAVGKLSSSGQRP